MGDFGDRLRQIQPAGERLEPSSEKGMSQAEFLALESLSEEERKALGSLFGEIEKTRRADAPLLGLAEWRDLLRRVRTRLAEEHLAPEERRALKEDVARMESRRVRYWARLIGVGGMVAAAAYYIVEIIAGL